MCHGIPTAVWRWCVRVSALGRWYPLRPVQQAEVPHSVPPTPHSHPLRFPLCSVPYTTYIPPSNVSPLPPTVPTRCVFVGRSAVVAAEMAQKFFFSDVSFIIHFAWYPAAVLRPPSLSLASLVHMVPNNNHTVAYRALLLVCHPASPLPLHYKHT